MKVGSFSEMMSDLRSDHDLTINGKCSGCGECCGSLLPVSENELSRVHAYVKRNNIEPCKHMNVMDEFPVDFTCPFLDSSKKKDKCKIYKQRFRICRAYKCDHNVNQRDNELLMMQQNFPVNLWTEFYPDSPEAKAWQRFVSAITEN